MKTYLTAFCRFTPQKLSGDYRHFAGDLFFLIVLSAYGFHVANTMDGVAKTVPFEMPDCLDIEFKEYFLTSY